MRTGIIIFLLTVMALFALESGGAERVLTSPASGVQTRQQLGSPQRNAGTATTIPRVVNTQTLTITGSTSDSKVFTPANITTQQLTITGSTPDAEFTPRNITTQQLTITGPSSQR